MSSVYRANHVYSMHYEHKKEALDSLSTRIISHRNSLKKIPPSIDEYLRF
jgi:hypothetical protein